LIIFTAGLVIFGIGAGTPLLWVDEYLTQAAVRRPWPDLLHWIVSRDPAPGPYYVVSKGWQTLVGSEDRFLIRLPSVVALAGAITVLASLVRRLTDPTTAWLVTGLGLALPVMSRFAQEGRPYAFAALTAVAVVWLWRRSLLPNGSRWWSVGYGAAVVATGLAHLYTLTLVPALIMAACLTTPTGDRQRAVGRTIIPAAIAGPALLPHLVLNLRHPTGSPTDGPITVASLAQLLRGLVPLPVAAVLAFLIMVAIVAAVRRQVGRETVIVAACWAVVPPLLMLGAKLAVDLPATKVRYLLFVMPAVAWLAAIGLRLVAQRWLPAAIVILVVVAAIGMPKQVHVRSVGGHHRDWALAPLLQVATDHGLPVITANPQAIRLVNAATYPRIVIDQPVDPARARYVVVVERTRYATSVPDDFVYYRHDGGWRPVHRCRIAQALVLIFESPDATAPRSLSRDALGGALDAAAPGEVICTRTVELQR
jgi:mannosyltransferase